MEAVFCQEDLGDWGKVFRLIGSLAVSSVLNTNHIAELLALWSIACGVLYNIAEDLGRDGSETRVVDFYINTRFSGIRIFRFIRFFGFFSPFGCTERATLNAIQL